MGDFFIKPVKEMNDGEVLDLGKHKLRFFLTPHVPHAWDAIIPYEETTGTLFASDLFAHFGETKHLTDSDIVEQALAVYKQFPEYLAVGPHTDTIFRRLEALEPKILAAHHSPVFTGNVAQALKDFRTGIMGKSGSPAI